MYKQVTIRCKGTQPLMLNNIQTASPLNEWTMKLKDVTSKKKKTEADTLEIIRLQFMSSWYVDEKATRNIHQEFEDGKQVMQNVRQAALNAEEKAKSMDLQAKFALLQSMFENNR